MLRALIPAATIVALMLAWEPALGADAEDDPVLARVDGVEVRRSEALRSRSRLPDRLQVLPEEQVLPLLVNITIDTKLVAGEARRQNVQDSPDVRAELAWIEDLVLEQTLLGRHIEEQMTDEAVQARYDELAAEVAKNEEVRARHILLETEEDARAVIAELGEGGDFAELAKERSVGPSASTGGDLGFFGKDDMVPAFADAAFALDAGAVTEDPVQTQFGWHVIKVEERRQAEPPAFAAVEQRLRADMGREIGAAYIEQLREAATIERVEPPAEEAPEEGQADEGQADEGETEGQSAQ